MFTYFNVLNLFFFYLFSSFLLFYSPNGQYRPKKYFNSPSSFKLALLLAASKVLLLRLATYIMKAFTTRGAYISQSITYAFFMHAGLCMYARRVYVLDSDMCEPSLKWAHGLISKPSNKCVRVKINKRSFDPFVFGSNQ